MPKFGRVIFDIKVSQFMKEKVTEFVGRKKDNLPIKTEITLGGAGAKTGGLITNSDPAVVETKLMFKQEKLIFDK